MKLEKILAKTREFAEKEKNFVKAAKVFALSRVPDMVSTIAYCSRYGTKDELSEWHKYFMDSFGVVEGSLLLNSAIIPSSLLLAYLFNRIDKRKKGLGTIALYITAGVGMLASIYNFIKYLTK